MPVPARKRLAPLLVGLVLAAVLAAACAPTRATGTAGSTGTHAARSVTTSTGAGSQPTMAEARACATAHPAGWMGCLVAEAPGFGEREITATALPGTHDSGTFDLDVDSFDKASGSDCSNYDPVYASVGALVDRWAKTQDLDYPQQLDAGVRYLDVRVAYTGTAAGGWRIVHTLFSAHPLAEDMAAIAGWARAHPTEVVVVDFQHVCYDNSPGAAADDELWSELAPLAAVSYDPTAGTPVPTATIDDIVRQGGGGHNVLVMLPSYVLQPQQLEENWHVHATFTTAPGPPVPAGAPTPNAPEQYAWPSTVGPATAAGDGAANLALAAYPTTSTPALGSLAGHGFYQSQLIYSLGSANEVPVLTAFGGLITPFASPSGLLPAWEQGLWETAPDRNTIVAGWGKRLNVVVTDHAEEDGFVAAVVAQDGA